MVWTSGIIPLHKAGAKLRTFWRQPLFIRIWLLPIWLALGVARAAILIVSFRRLSAYLGRALGASPWVPLLSTSQEKRASQVSTLVRMAAKYTPWESNCFTQALVARMVLGWLGIPCTMYFGLARDAGADAGKLRAHAWVAAGRVYVTGGLGHDKFTVVGSFVSLA